MERRRNESVPRIYAPHNHRDQLPDNMSENPSGNVEWHVPRSTFVNNLLSNQVHRNVRTDGASHDS